MALSVLPTLLDFGIPKSQLIVATDPDKQVLYTQYNDLGTFVVDIGDSVGLDDGSTPGSLREDVKYLSTTVVWRPGEPSPAGNVYANFPSAIAAVSSSVGSVTIILDATLSPTFTVPAAAYALACRELRFVGLDFPIMDISDGVTITGNTIVSLIFDDLYVGWFGTTVSLLGTTGKSLDIKLRRRAYIESGGSIQMFDVDIDCAVRLEGTSSGLSSAGAYELFTIADSCLLALYVEGLLCVINGDIARSSGGGANDGAVTLYLNTTQAPTFPETLTNLNGDYTVRDGAGNIALVSSSATVAVPSRTRTLVLTNAGATIDVTLPDGFSVEGFRAYKANAVTAQTINLIRSATDIGAGGTINGTAATYVFAFPGLVPGGTYTSFDVRGIGVGTWIVESAIFAAFFALGAYVGTIDTRTTSLEARTTALEAPTSVDANNAAVSWTTVARYRNIHSAALAVFTLDGSTGQWPSGQSRILANFSTAAFGIRVNVPVGHYLNNVLNGTTGTQGAFIAVDSVPIYSMLLTREDATHWSWS